VTCRSCITSSSALDFVGQQQITEHRPQRRREVARLLVVDACPDEVGRDEVRRELDTLELTLDRIRQRIDGQRLREPGHALDEEVPPRQ
jgi:hypothetical protein